MAKDNAKIIKLCFKYNFSCKKCPRNAKCEKELKGEISNGNIRKDIITIDDGFIRNNDIHSSSRKR